jgi:sulfatase maturation enzyme AslB (radical SAM superfamily)
MVENSSQFDLSTILEVLPQPEPAAGVEFYDREREKALELNPRKRENFEKFERSSHLRNDVCDYLPKKIDFENVSRCNFRCSMCQVSNWHKGQRAEDMSLEDFKRIIDEQYGLVEIKLQGMGEPLMQGDDFFRMIRYARDQHIWVRTTTNASLLHLKDNIQKLINADPCEVQISIDGADKETFEKIRVQSNFDQVIKNCQLINSAYEEDGLVRTKMWVVVQKENRHQLTKFVHIAREAGFKSLVFSVTLTDWGQLDWRAKNNDIDAHDAFSIEIADELVHLGADMGVKVAFWSPGKKYSTQNIESICPWPFERSYISSDLRVVPCCAIANPDASELGSADNFTETWNGQAYRDFRRKHLSGDIPEVCQNCYE